MSARAEILPVFVPHLGCGHACVFCNQRRISGEKTPASAVTVRRAVREAEGLPRAGKRELAFYGGSFTAIDGEKQEELLRAAKEALDAGKIDAIRLSTRPDAIDEAVLARLRFYGVETVELGAQSMDDTVLAASRRGHTAGDVFRACAMVKAAGFRLVLQMMTGLPGDSPGRCVETARRLIRCRPDGVRIYPTVIVKDTELYELWQAGAYREHTVEDAVNVCAVFDNEEVGSATRQGADSSFLYDTLTRLGFALGASDGEIRAAMAGSFMVSADNAHAVHPNHPEKFDKQNRTYMNKGVVIKHNANQKYTTDAVSGAIMRAICNKAGVPYQTFLNRSDMLGGSTLGNISQSQVALNTVDIGLAQLAMHSPYETAGAKDTAYLIEAAKVLFSSSVEGTGNGNYKLKF